MTRAVRVTVGVPVFRGQDLVAEALRSIQSQTDANFRVIVSVDNGDEVSAAVCRTFEDDPRFRIVVQQERLGWAGNINWLVGQTDTEFFQYLAQDDRIDPACHETLIAYADRNPQALIVAPDVKVFGERELLQSDPPLPGSVFDRVVAQLSYGRGTPNYGLIRTAALRAVPPLLVDRFNSSLEIFVWIMNIARIGEIHFVRRVLYFKRLHAASEGHKIRKWEPGYLRAAWIDAWVRLVAAAWPAVSTKDEARTLLTVALSQVVSPRSGYEFFFHTDLMSTRERRQMSEDLMTAIEREPGLDVASVFGADWHKFRARCLAEANIRRSLAEWLRVWKRHPGKMLRRRLSGTAR
jgi:hypothetical protein